METKNGPELVSTKMLRDALLDSELLLSFASEQGVIIEPKFIKSIIKAKRNEQNNTWTEQEEVEFWTAFQIISKRIRPVTIDSLRAAATPIEKPLNWWQKITFSKNHSMVERSVSWYRKLALFFMIIMLALQIYGIIGAALMAKYASSNDKLLEAEKRMNELVILTSNNTADQTSSTEQLNVDNEIQDLANGIQSIVQLMDKWLKFTPNIWSGVTKEDKESASSPTINLDPSSPIEVRDASYQSVIVVQQANSLIIILNQYILPLLYGLIGGFAFVLRSLAEETKKMVYTPTSDIKFGLRIHLGALAGLVIGFLWGDFQGKSFGIVESLSPLAVAFLAGYSVDFIFRMLDSLIGNIAKRENVVVEAAVEPVAAEPTK